MFNDVAGNNGIVFHTWLKARLGVTYPPDSGGGCGAIVNQIDTSTRLDKTLHESAIATPEIQHG